MRTIELRMDITNTCNLKCIMCHLPYAQQMPHMVTIDEFKKTTAGILSKTSVLSLSWATEPFLNPHLPDILRETRRAGVPCVTVVTNCTLFPAYLEETIHYIHRLHVSIDAIDPAVYAAIRQRDCLPTVIENIRKIQELKKRKGTKFPRIALNCILLRMNLGELRPIVDLAVSLGIDELNLSYISVPDRYNEGALSQDLLGLPPDFNLKNEVVTPEDHAVHRILKDAIAYAESKRVLITVAGRFSIVHPGFLSGYLERVRYSIRKGLRFPPRALVHLGFSFLLNKSKLRTAYCTFPFRQMVLTADGLVLPCCVWDDKESMGTIATSTLGEIWNGPSYADLRKRMLNKDLPRQCAQCTRVNSKKRHGV